VGILVLALVGCSTHPPVSKPQRLGDEIVVNGRLMHTGTRVVLWLDPGGFNAYTGKHFNERPVGQPIDQFVLHYDACGSSRQCFAVLEQRGLSVHFMCDVDGTIYQTLDARERAWHATKANNRSVGVEVANIGAYPSEQLATLQRWRQLQHVATPLVGGQVQGHELYMCDFTPQQYAALQKLTAALCTSLPEIRYDYPRDVYGHVVNHVLSDEQWTAYHGVLGHYHVQANKDDPGPAMQWDRVVNPSAMR
jgi:N-acetylmuramoyl-L-alanine amidase